MKPNLFTYDDYRSYLRDVYDFLKETKHATSFRFLARQAGFASPNFFKLVMDGKRNLSLTSASKMAKALKLNREEVEFFENLVFFNQAKSTEEKTKFYERMKKSRHYREMKELESGQFEYFSNWYYTAVRELVSLESFQEDPKWIAQHLTPPITPKEAERALELLQELKLLRRNAEGRLEQVDRVIASGSEVKSLAIKSYHQQMIQIASKAIDEAEPMEREINGSMFAVPASKIEDLKAKIQDFHKELLSIVSSYDDKYDRLYELNVQLFPVSKGEDPS